MDEETRRSGTDIIFTAREYSPSSESAKYNEIRIGMMLFPKALISVEGYEYLKSSGLFWAFLI